MAKIRFQSAEKRALRARRLRRLMLQMYLEPSVAAAMRRQIPARNIAKNRTLAHESKQRTDVVYTIEFSRWRVATSLEIRFCGY